MDVTPQHLVELGQEYRFPAGPRYGEEVCTLAPVRGPSLDMRFGAVAVADPWLPSAVPEYPVIGLGGGAKATMVVAISRSRSDGSGVDSQSVAATIGDIDQVVSWEPLLADGTQFQLDVDSALGVFYEITDAVLLRPLFEDDRYMQGIYEAALSELIVPMVARGRMVASAFMVSGGSGLHPVWAGFDQDMAAVAMMLDTGLLRYGDRVPVESTSKG